MVPAEVLKELQPYVTLSEGLGKGERTATVFCKRLGPFACTNSNSCMISRQ